jgi:GSH-dependent disulfide-bond oxidoreductase
MIDVHYWTTPNGHKVTIFLEEAGLQYKIIPVNIGKGEQFKAEFLAVSPNNRIPAIVDHAPVDGGKPLPVFESGAILLYLADKTGKFIAKDLRARTAALEWLFWQMGGLGPMSGQNNHFSNYAVDKIQYAMDRYRNEVNRLYGVMNKRLADRPYLAGDYSIADMACYPWGSARVRTSPTSRISSGGSRRSRRGRPWSRPMNGRRRSTPAKAASAPRRSARFCLDRPRSRSPRRRGKPNPAGR